MHRRFRLHAAAARLREAGRRAVALGCGALVLALGLLAVLPEAHAWLHAANEASSCCTRPHAGDSLPAGGDDAGCVVALFAQGVEAGAAMAALTPIPAWRGAGDARLPESPALSPPRYLHRPERGPPAAASVGVGPRR